MRVESVQWPNVQALLMSSFSQLRCAAYVLFRFDATAPGSNASEWLWRLCQRVASAAHDPAAAKDRAAACAGPIYVANLAELKALMDHQAPPADVWALNVAFTPSGLAALGASPAELGRFSSEFQVGMAPPADAKGEPGRRSSLLGDLGDNAPRHWRWGGWGACNRFDGALLLYARSPASIRRLLAAELAAMRGTAEPMWCDARTGQGAANLPQARLYPSGMGHFGFVDGISQPVIEGTPRAARMPAALRDVSLVAPGEFILGYRDTRGAVVRYDDPTRPGSRDLGRNGTYLVVRQLEQDVEAYRGFVRKAATAVLGRDDQEAFDWVSGKLLGRAPGGEALIAPPEDCADEEQRLNGFRYHSEDGDGLCCPLGSHIRRANPRDVVGPDPETALRLSRMHRIIRRGRPYGPMLPRTRAARGAGLERGLFFLCLNASLAGQFELVQHSWINNPQFRDLDGEVDPLSHVAADTVTIQSRPSNVRLAGRKPFVRVRGGAYFFMPGLNAMRELAEAGLAHATARAPAQGV